MIEGFWILRIDTPQVASGGVVVFLNGRIYGGDNGFTWVGSYAEDKSLIKGRVNVHNFDPSVPSVLGLFGDYDMHISGTVDGDTIKGTAMLANQPQHSLAIRLHKKANF